MSGTAVCPTCGAPVGQGARFCATCGTPLGEAAPEERKLATILFADVIGSTDLGEQLDPERLRALLQDYFAAMSTVVDTWGGTIEKYIGDAILAVWGVPAAREDDPIRALHAAHDMLAELERINPDLDQRHGVRLGLRIGVNTGEVLAPVGAHPAGQFLVSGDAVNVAARLQQAAEPGTVLVGERTWAGARTSFAFEDPIELTVRGKRAVVVARRLGAPASGEAAVGGGARPLQARMLGRDRELGTLLGLLDEVVEIGQPRLVIVSGPAGMGKSRMLREFISGAQQGHPELVVLRGRCLATGHGIAYWALGEVLRQLCAISLDEPADSASDKLERRVAGPLAAVGLNADDIARSAAALATSANLPLAHNPLRDLSPEDMAEEMAQAWPRLLTGLCRAHPLALVVEDVHWADEPMLRMLDVMATRARGPVLIIATARPEFLEAHAGFGNAADLEVVSLRALTDAQSAQLVSELLGSAELPAGLIDDIQRKADGNPFFLEEIIQRLIDEGALTTHDGRWQATDSATSVQLPDTIYALLAARIDALPADEKRLLQEAAVVGRVFWPGALGAGVATEDVLRRAERRGLISLRPISTIANEPEYMFRHVLIRDVAYNSVPRKRRALAHADTGRWVESLAGDRLDEFGELIAYHYAAAVTGEEADLGWAGNDRGREATRRRAFEMLIRSGGSARRRLAVDKALELHGQALEIAATDAERARVHEELGDDDGALYRGDDAVSDYLKAVDLAERDREPAHRVADLSSSPGGHVPPTSSAAVRARAVAKAARTVIRWGSFRREPPIGRVQRLIDDCLGEPLDDAVRATLLICAAALTQGPSGIPIGAGRVVVPIEQMADLVDRIALVDEGLAVARRLDDADLQHFAYDVLAILYMSTRQEERYRRTYEEALTLLDRVTSRSQQVDLLVGVSGARADGGKYEEALVTAEEAFHRAADLSPHERMHAAWEIERAAEPLGQWDRIVELLPWYAEVSAQEAGVTCAAVRAGPAFGATVLARRGMAHEADRIVPVAGLLTVHQTFGAGAVAARYALAMGRPDRSNAIVDAALERMGTGFLTTGAAPMLDLLFDLDRFTDLERFIPIASAEESGNALVRPTLERTNGRLALARGDTALAAGSLRAALAGFRQLKAPYEMARTAELLATATEGPERSQLLRGAVATYEQLGAVPYAQHARDALEHTSERLAR